MLQISGLNLSVINDSSSSKYKYDIRYSIQLSKHKYDIRYSIQLS